MELNLGSLNEAIAAVVPDRPCIVAAGRTHSYAEVADRSRRLANYLTARGLRLHTPRADLADHESGQDHVALYLHNGPEYLEGMLGAYKARLVPFNVNYRYVADELRHLFADASARAVIYHECFVPHLAEVLDDLPGLSVLIQVADGSGHDLLPGAVDYEAALAAADPEPPGDLSPDDLYMIYTGGTTGLPKGVLWRQADIAVKAIHINRPEGEDWASLEELTDAVKAGPPRRFLTAAPFMHGAGQWLAFHALGCGGTIVLPDVVERLDPADMLGTLERERVDVALVVGDAFVRPLLDELDAGSYDLSSLTLLYSGGAALSPSAKAAILRYAPQVEIHDSIGSSEAGGQGSNVSTATTEPTTGAFTPRPGTMVIDTALSEVLPPGHDGDGWLASVGRIPLGYLGDPDKTARTFPVLADGTRASVPGDRARHRADGSIEVLGRDSVTINSGGEKIFAEEVEAALLAHPDVRDAVVVGRDSERWGSEVVALVVVRPGAALTAEALAAACATRLARYKLPKAVLFVDAMVRSPAGKADYRWARQVAAGARA